MLSLEFRSDDCIELRINEYSFTVETSEPKPRVDPYLGLNLVVGSTMPNIDPKLEL